MSSIQISMSVKFLTLVMRMLSVRIMTEVSHVSADQDTLKRKITVVQVSCQHIMVGERSIL